MAAKVFAWQNYWQVFACPILFIFSLSVNAESHVSDQVHDVQRERQGFEVIRLCAQLDFMPYESIDEQGQYIGIIADFIRLLAEKMHKQLVLVKTLDTQQAQEFLKQQRCDIMSVIAQNKEAEGFLNVTEPLLQQPIGLAALADSEFIGDISQALEHRFAVVQETVLYETLRSQYPSIKITPVENAKIGLAMVASGKLFAYIDSVAIIAYQVQKQSILNIKIAGELALKFPIAIAIRKDNPLLLGEFNGAIAELREQEKLFILNKWLSINYQRGFNYGYLSQYLAPIFVMLLAFLVHYVFLLRNNKKLQTSNNKLMSENECINSVLEQEQQAVNQSIQFAEMISHEYRTPVSIISTNLDILALKNQQKAFAIDSQLTKMRDSVAKLIALVETALSREKLLTGKLVAHKIRVDFYLIVQQVLFELKKSYPRRQVVLHCEQIKLPFFGDPELLILLLTNLLENAFKYSASDKVVALSLVLSAKQLTIEVADQGIGIMHTDMEHIFDKYHRASNAVNTSGIGLGLFMAKLVVVQHGGEISVVCPVEGGTMVRILFPVPSDND
ncbi:MAG: transporter substrate-binding domain-containing protein [Methylococcaceae bacterium]|nr:transporter substrate-binding domain-containing protein [Methylococcaceae bacterium]